MLDRYMVENLTVEALSEVLRDDGSATQRAPASKVWVRSDGLAELFGNLDRYMPGAEAAVIAALISAVQRGPPCR